MLRNVHLCSIVNELEMLDSSSFVYDDLNRASEDFFNHSVDGFDMQTVSGSLYHSFQFLDISRSDALYSSLHHCPNFFDHI